jgi:hypothetical protein
VVVAKKDLAPTRLQLRWTEDERGECVYRCYYELVLPLGESDLRREQQGPRGGKRPDRTALVVPIADTGRNSTASPGTLVGEGGVVFAFFDAPYRDGRHAEWDAAHLGDLPIYMVTVDGVYLKRA